MVTATVTSKGQITIPKVVRDSLRLRSGDRIEFEVRGDREAVLRPITLSVDDVYGMLHRPGMRARTVEEMDQGIARYLKARKR